MSAVLDVSGLKTHFFTHAGVVKAALAAGEPHVFPPGLADRRLQSTVDDVGPILGTIGAAIGEDERAGLLALESARRRQGLVHQCREQDDPQQQVQLLQQLLAAGIEVYHFAVERRNMQEVYLQTVKHHQEAGYVAKS